MTFRYDEGRLRRLELSQKKGSELDPRYREFLDAQTSNQTPGTGAQDLPPIVQRLTNTDLSHSVGTWYQQTPTAGDQNFECANVYAHEPPAPVVVLDGAIAAGDNTLFSTSNPFTAGHVGSRCIVHGAGAGGGKLVTTIASFTSSGEVELSAAAATTVSGARVRFNLQKLERVNSITNPAAVTNDALKSADHTDYATNIDDPDWERPNGWARIGSTNTLDFFLGAYTDAAPHTTFEPYLYGIQAQRYMYVIAKIAKKHRGVKIGGAFYAGLWNNDDRNLDYLTGGEFNLEATIRGTPAVTATTQYLVVAQTDRGLSYYTSILSVPGAPAIGSYVPGEVQVELSWRAVPFTIRYEIYRQIGAGPVERIFTVTTGATRFIDDNPVQRVAVGAFPSPTSLDNNLKALTGTMLGALDDLVSDGEGGWGNLRLAIPMPSTIDVSEMTELVLRMGLTEPLAFEIDDAVTTASDTTVTSAAALFSADHAGKTCTISDPTTPANTLTTTVASVTGPGEIELAAAPSWTFAANVIEILDAEPRGLYLDLIGLSFNDGQWSPHTKDDPRPQPPVARPNSSTQGGTGITPPAGGGGVRCFFWASEVTEFETRRKVPAIEIRPGMRLFNGFEHPAVVKAVRHHIASELWRFEYESGECSALVTSTHRFVDSFENVRAARAVRHFRAGDAVLRWKSNRFMMDFIRRVVHERFELGATVVTIELVEDERNEFSRTFLLGDDLSHNRKFEDWDLPETES